MWDRWITYDGFASSRNPVIYLCSQEEWFEKKHLLLSELEVFWYNPGHPSGVLFPVFRVSCIHLVGHLFVCLFIEWRIIPPFQTPQIFHLILLSRLCSVPLTSGFTTRHKSLWGVLTAGLINFWNWRDDKTLVVQMCFVGSIYRAQGLWQEQLMLPFSNLGKSGKNAVGTYFHVVLKGKMESILWALGRTVTVLGTRQFCSFLWKWRRMKGKDEGKGDSPPSPTFSSGGKKTQTHRFSQFTHWE